MPQVEAIRRVILDVTRAGQSTVIRVRPSRFACCSFTSSTRARASHGRRTAAMRAGDFLPVSAETARAPLIGMTGINGSA